MRAKFTDVLIQSLEPGTYMDEKTPAFGIRVGVNRKTWLVVKGERRTKVRLGHYPAMSLAEARKRALVTLGSPMQEKPTISFPEAVESFLALPRWRFHSRRVLESSLRHFKWKRNLDKITYEDIAEAIDAVKAPSARAHALKDIRTFFNWTVPRYLPHSPAVGLKMPPQPSRDRILAPEEVKAIWNACEGSFGTIVRLLLLTGQRKKEIGSLRWSYITDTAITFPPEAVKNGREHTIPLGAFAKSLLPSKGNGYVFRATGSEDVYNGYAYHHGLLLKASGTSGWTLHDLRRTFVSIHSELKTPIHVAEKLVNHVSGSFAGVRGIYDRYSYFDEMAEALALYEQKIADIVGVDLPTKAS